MSAEIVELRPGAVGDAYKVSPEDVLNAALGKLVTVAVVGWDERGEMYVAGSDGAETTFFLLALANKYLLDHRVERT